MYFYIEKEILYCNNFKIPVSVQLFALLIVSLLLPLFNEQKYKSHNLELLMLFISLSNCTKSYFFENMKEMHLYRKI